MPGGPVERRPLRWAAADDVGPNAGLLEEPLVLRWSPSFFHFWRHLVGKILRKPRMPLEDRNHPLLLRSRKLPEGDRRNQLVAGSIPCQRRARDQQPKEQRRKC